LFLLIGIIMLASNIASPSAQAYEIPGVFAADSAVDIPSVKRMLSAVVFPAALLERDAKGEARIVAVNESMASMADSTPDTMKGKLLNAMLPQLQNDAGLISSGVKWIPHRSLMGGKILFMLSPSVKISRASSGAGGSGLFDPNTGVYTRSSMRHLGGVLIKACLRYKKTLSLLLLKLDFEKKSTVSPSDDKKQNAWRAFGKIVLLSIRADDMAFCVDEYEIAIFLPEYSSLDIKYLIEDIHDKINKIAVVECPEIGLSVVYDSSFCGNIDSVDSCDLIIEGLRDGINRNKAA
jgi:GGDEF domain-containing protein